MIGARLVRERFRAMGTDCEVAVTATRANDGQAQRALAAGRREIEACEQVLSRFDERSDLSRLNRAGGDWVRVDRRLIEALGVARRTREETGGRYDPTILPALIAAGYDRSFEQLGERLPATLVGWRPWAAVEIDAAGSQARIAAGAAVDLGGIGKGFAATLARWAMSEAWLEVPGGLVDLGGDVLAWGATPEGGPWRLAVADPRLPGTTIATLAIDDGAAATSGCDRRRFGPGRTLHHLIDPATGAPAKAGPLSVTVVGPDAAEAEAYATALAVTPPGEAGGCLRDRPGLSALVVPRAGEAFVIGDLPVVAEQQLTEVTA